MLSNPTYIYVLPLMALNIIPRMLNLVIFFGVWNIEKAIECALISIQAFLIYLVGFAFMIRKLYSFPQNRSFYCTQTDGGSGAKQVQNCISKPVITATWELQ